MEKKYCEYCGALLEDHCGCAREIAEYEEERLKAYYDDPSVQAGWAFEDLMFNWELERK